MRNVAQRTILVCYIKYRSVTAGVGCLARLSLSLRCEEPEEDEGAGAAVATVAVLASPFEA